MKRVREQEGIELNMTPMIDVVFNLLVFLMVVSDLSRKEFDDVALPFSTTAVPDEGEPRTIVNIVKSPAWERTGEVSLRVGGVDRSLARTSHGLARFSTDLAAQDLRRTRRDDPRGSPCAPDGALNDDASTRTLCPGCECRSPAATPADVPCSVCRCARLHERSGLAQLRDLLFLAAERKRPEAGAPSEATVLIRCDKDVRWREVQWVLKACARDPARIFRIQFATAEE